MNDQTRKLTLERARVIASTLLTISDATGEAVTPDQVQRVALVKLSPVAVRHSVIAANLVLGVIEQLALILAGLGDDQALEALETMVAEFIAPAKLAPAPRRRGRVAAPDGYTDAEREYMKGAGVIPGAPGAPGQPPTPPAPPPAPGAQPAQPGLGTRKKQTQEDQPQIRLTPDEVAAAWLFGDLIAPTPDPEGNRP